jgi:predicted component of type VI protein secretion system
VNYGELIPTGGGDPIPLIKSKLLVGRRENCDIVLRFANISAHHCQLTLEHGYWFVKDLGSRNGTKVNGKRVMRKRVDPGDMLAFAKHQYEVRYQPTELGATGPPPPDEETISEIMARSLLDRAGLDRRRDGDEDMGRPRIR